LLAEGAAQQVDHAGHQAVGIDRLRIERLASSKGEQAVS
jgi:hypothetical protein